MEYQINKPAPTPISVTLTFTLEELNTLTMAVDRAHRTARHEREPNHRIYLALSNQLFDIKARAWSRALEQ